MSNGANTLSGLHYLKIALECFEDTVRQYPGSKLSKVIETYCNRINWILKDFSNHHILPERIRQALKEDINSDVFTNVAIMEKLVQLKPQSREAVENMIDVILAGGKVTIQSNKE